jgi:hypothetical protein
MHASRRRESYFNLDSRSTEMNIGVHEISRNGEADRASKANLWHIRQHALLEGNRTVAPGACTAQHMRQKQEGPGAVASHAKKKETCNPRRAVQYSVSRSAFSTPELISLSWHM